MLLFAERATYGGKYRCNQLHIKQCSNYTFREFAFSTSRATQDRRASSADNYGLSVAENSADLVTTFIIQRKNLNLFYATK